MKYPNVTAGQTEAAINIVGGWERFLRFLAGEFIIAEKGAVGSPLEASPNSGVTYARGLDIQAFLKDWTRFYKEVFGRIVDLSTIPLPSFRPGFGWGVAVVPGVTTDLAYRVSHDRFGAYKYTEADLDEAVPTNERTTANGHIIWCRDTVEADQELKNTSANQIAEQRLRTMTLLERELLGLWYHWKTGGKHLDIINWTLCSGSRDSYGDVPGVRRGVDELRVFWYFVVSRDADIRAREVVEVV